MPSPTQKKGAIAEARAEAALIARGYRILHRNWRGGGAEVDRIAQDGNTLCFVEIRSRRSVEWGRPEETVDRLKQAKLIRVAHAYLTRFRGRARPPVRFDVVAIVEEPPEVTVFENAFP